MISAQSSKKLNIRLATVVLITLGLKQPLFSQTDIQFEFNNVKLKPALKALIDIHGMAIIFPDSIPNTPINAKCDDCNMEEAISKVLASTELTWEKTDTQFIIQIPRSKSYSSISGRIIDELTSEPIPYANIFIPGPALGAASNHDGIFSISSIYAKSCSLIISYIGYDKKVVNLHFPKDNRKNYQILLRPKVLSTKEISIFGIPKEFMNKSNNPGQVSFSPRHIASLPNLGEIDIFRSLQFLPGIQLGLGETSKLYIRGGSPDQNLILLDWMPIYQTGHMFDFVSGISSNAIKDVQVLKGSIPSLYGGRISSVINISSKAGDSNNGHGALYGNLMSQGLSVEIPLSKRGSYIINLRQSNPSGGYSKLYNSIQKYVTGDDQFNLLNASASEQAQQSTYYNISSSYQDIVGRLSLLISKKHRLTITHLNGIDSVLENREYFGFNSILGSDSILIEENNNIKSKGIVLNYYSNWNHNYNSHFSVSGYSINNRSRSLQFPKTSNNALLDSNKTLLVNGLIDRSIRFHQKYTGIRNHNISAGFEEKIFKLDSKIDYKDGSSTNSSNLKEKAYNYSFYLEDQWILIKPLEITSGIRFSYYRMNEKKLHQEPRIAAKYGIFQNLSLEVSIGKHHQFVHHYVNEDNIQNNWILSSNAIPVISSVNKHAGINWDTKNFTASLSTYKRNLSNVFRINTSLRPPNYNPDLNAMILIGSGVSNGIELIMRKKIGAVRGWLSYHFNHTTYNFPNFNSGVSFFADHNRSDELKTVVITRILGVDLSANWVFSSGGVYTDINNIYIETGSGFTINTTGRVNEERLPPVHHLDIAISRSWKVKSFLIDLGLSVYNIYNKKNISHKRYNPYTSQLSMSDVSMFGVTPSINLKMSF